MRFAGHVAHMGRRKMCTGFSVWTGTLFQNFWLE